MGQWVITVAGIAVLSVLCEVILPEGQTRKYIKTVIGVIVTLVMLQPIVNLISGSAKIETPSDEACPTIQQPYLDAVDKKQIAAKERDIQRMLSANGVDVSDVDISTADKTVTVTTQEKESPQTSKIINSAINRYLDGYAIKVKWK